MLLHFFWFFGFLLCKDKFVKFYLDSDGTCQESVLYLYKICSFICIMANRILCIKGLFVPLIRELFINPQRKGKASK